MQQVIIIWISDEISSRCKIEWLRNLVGSIADKFRGWDLILTFSRGTKIRLKLCSLHNSKKKNCSALMYELAIVQIGKSSWMVWHDLCASRTCHTVELCLHKMALMSIWCRLINFANLTIWSFCLYIFLSFCLSVFLSFCLSVFPSSVLLGMDGWVDGMDGWMVIISLLIMFTNHPDLSNNERVPYQKDRVIAVFAVLYVNLTNIFNLRCDSRILPRIENLSTFCRQLWVLFQWLCDFQIQKFILASRQVQWWD